MKNYVSERDLNAAIDLIKTELPGEPTFDIWTRVLTDRMEYIAFLPGDDNRCTKTLSTEGETAGDAAMKLIKRYRKEFNPEKVKAMRIAALRAELARLEGEKAA